MIPIGDITEPRRSFPLINLSLIAANIAVFVYELSFPSNAALETFFRSAGVIPIEYVTGRDIPPPAPYGLVYTTLFTSMFMHGGWLHIGSNMLYLWLFGDNVEDRMGKIGYLFFYVLCGIAASVTHIFLNFDSPIPSVGASGAIAGVLGGYFLMFSKASVRTLVFIGPFITVTRIPALLLIGFWFLTQLVSGFASIGHSAQTAGVAVWAHVGGFAAGLVLTPFLQSRPRSTWQPRPF